MTDSTGIALKAYSEDKIIIDVIIGETSTDFGHTYVRANGSNDTVIWRGPFNILLKRKADEWRDKTIYSFNADDIINFKAVQGGQTRELAFADSIWVYDENNKVKPIDQDNTKELISLIASLKCDAFADEEDIGRMAGKDPDTRMSFTVRNGDIHVFDVWSPAEKAKNKRYLVRKENGEVITFVSPS